MEASSLRASLRRRRGSFGSEGTDRAPPCGLTTHTTVSDKRHAPPPTHHRDGEVRPQWSNGPMAGLLASVAWVVLDFSIGPAGVAQSGRAADL